MTAPVNNASFYADFGSLAALKRDARADGQKALREAARQFESLFTDMMLKSMRAASIGDSMTGSDSLDMYQGMFDQQLAVQMSKGRGLGLADMLVQQLTRSGLVSPADNAGADPSSQITPDATLPGGDITTDSSAVPATEAISAAIPADSQISSESAIVADDSKLSWPPATREEFVQRMLPHAQVAARQLGVDPSTLVAHAALETGWGKHMPAHADGSSSFNLFGIKATRAWQGQSVGATTLEYEQGVAVKRVERFKSYDSPTDCFADYAKLLAGAGRYAGVRNSGDNANQFAQSLQQGGYATDPHYASKLRAVVGVVRSVQIDSTQVSATPADT